MSKKLIVRLSLDAALFVLYLVALGERATGGLAHEIIGVILLLLVLAHNVLNFRWFAGLSKGRHDTLRIIATVTDFLLIIFMLLLALSAIMISQELFSLLNFGNFFDGRMLHTFAAGWGLLLIGFHLGLHWRMAIGAAKKLTKLKENKVRTCILRVLVLLISIFGIYAFIALELYEKLFLLSTYSSGNTEWYILYPELAGIAVLFAAIGHYLTVIVNKNRNKVSKEN